MLPLPGWWLAYTTAVGRGAAQPHSRTAGPAADASLLDVCSSPVLITLHTATVVRRELRAELQKNQWDGERPVTYDKAWENGGQCLTGSNLV